MRKDHDQIRVVRSRERTTGPATPGMVREQAFTTDRLWAGLVRTDPSMTSGWHHHGEYETAIFVLSGALRIESGPQGSQVVEAGPGDFVLVPRSVVHRESNPSDEPAELIGVRAGHGESTISVAGPA